MCDLFSLPIPTFLPLLPCITNWLEAVEDATRRFGSCPALRDKINCDASGRKRPQILVEETDPAFLHGFSPLEKTRKEGGLRTTVPEATLLSFLSVRVIHAVSSTAETALGVERVLSLVLGHCFHSLVHVRRPVLDRPWEGKRGKGVLDGLPHFSYALQVVECPRRHQARLILARPKRT